MKEPVHLDYGKYPGGDQTVVVWAIEEGDGPIPGNDWTVIVKKRETQGEKP